MTDAQLLLLHREMVSIPSESHQEAALCGWLGERLASEGVCPERIGDNLVAAFGEGPALCFNSHLDTVPSSPGWTRPPHPAVVEQGRVYGLGSNDAKASAAAMLAAFLRLWHHPPPGLRLVLTLVAEEESGGKGTELILPRLGPLDAVVVGEPTGMEIAIAQKGLLVLELLAQGRSCHAAHAQALGAPNALRRLASDLTALDRVELGPAHPLLGPVTVEPTLASGGTARNVTPAEARCVLDLRTNPEPGHAALVERLRASVSGELRVLSDRLTSCSIEPGDPLVRAAQRARPKAELIGSRGVSDLVFFAAAGVPGIKVGPGATERSHTPDEYVWEEEILEGARFYEQVARAYPPAAGKERRP